MRTLFKFLLVFIVSTTLSFAKTGSINSQLVSTNFPKSDTKTSNPINLVAAGSVLVLAFCAFRFRKKIV